MKIWIRVEDGENDTEITRQFLTTVSETQEALEALDKTVNQIKVALGIEVLIPRDPREG